MFVCSLQSRTAAWSDGSINVVFVVGLLSVVIHFEKERLHSAPVRGEREIYLRPASELGCFSRSERKTTLNKRDTSLSDCPCGMHLFFDPFGSAASPHLDYDRFVGHLELGLDSFSTLEYFPRPEYVD